jgi:hypothetical protein
MDLKYQDRQQRDRLVGARSEALQGRLFSLGGLLEA